MICRGLILTALLAIAPAARVSGQAEVPTAPKIPSIQKLRDDRFIRNAFQSQFQPDQLAAFGKKPSLENLVKAMSPEQRQGAKTSLAALEGEATRPEEFEQIAEAYLLLNSPDEASLVALKMQEQRPDDFRGFTMGARAAFDLGDYPAAAEQAAEARKRNPNDQNAFAVLMLSKGRTSLKRSTTVEAASFPPAPAVLRQESAELPASAPAGSTPPLKPQVKVGPAKPVPAFTFEPRDDSKKKGGMPLWPIAAVAGLGAAAYGVQQSRRSWAEQESEPPAEEVPDSDRIQRNRRRLIALGVATAIGFGIVFGKQLFAAAGGLGAAKLIRDGASSFQRLVMSEAGSVNPSAPMVVPERVRNLLTPAGQRIGQAGSSADIRIVRGTIQDAEALFSRLTQGAKIVPHPILGPAGRLAELANNSGSLALRSVSKSGPPTIDVNVPGVNIREIKFISP
ncbi:MAG: hypothetical protein HY924_08505 [Elusimicrobia bacterium]|nr:hypothetical protein [Elusimicrobiota bacterium]